MTVLNFLTSLRIFQEQKKIVRFERPQNWEASKQNYSPWRLTSKPGVYLLELLNHASLVSLQVNTLLQMKDHRSLVRSSYPAAMETFQHSLSTEIWRDSAVQCSRFLRLLCWLLEVHRSSYFHDILHSWSQKVKETFFWWIACWRVNRYLNTVLKKTF